MLTKIVLALYN